MLELRLFFADAIAVIHAIFSLFVLIGLAWLLAGVLSKGRYSPGKIFRTLHLVATVALLVRLAFGLPCPFSVLENGFRGDFPSGGRTTILLHRLAFRNANPKNFQGSTIVVSLLTLSCNLLLRRQAFERSEPEAQLAYGSSTSISDAVCATVRGVARSRLPSRPSRVRRE
jgi:hypothetical protein